MDDNSHGSTHDLAGADAGWVSLFEDRYGIGSQERLLALLRQPCVTFARIARDFGVTRECVRQWHWRLLPHAPSGHERQRQCRVLRRRRHLFEDPLFVSFYRRVRTGVPGVRVVLIPTRDGFRRRTVRVGPQLIALTQPTLLALDPGGPRVYAPAALQPDAELVYCDLGPSDFLLLPRHLAENAVRVVT